MVQIKRAYDKPTKADGYRILVDRLWPRGVTKAALQMDEWAKDLAPSNELRRDFGHDPAHWKEFRSRYRLELTGSKEKITALAQRAKKGTVTLLFGAKDLEHNNAVVLKQVVEKKMKRSSKVRTGL